MNDKRMNQITLDAIIKRKIAFINNNPIYDKIEYQDYNEGETLAFDEILIDIKSMNESEFASKYLGIINELKKSFENEEFKDDQVINQMSGYNNAIVEILELVNPIYKYEIDD